MLRNRPFTLKSCFVPDVVAVVFALASPALPQTRPLEQITPALRQADAAFETCEMSFIRESQLHDARRVPAEVAKYQAARAEEIAARKRTEQGLPPPTHEPKQAIKDPAAEPHRAGFTAPTHGVLYVDRKHGKLRMETQIPLPPEQRDELRRFHERSKADIEAIPDEGVRSRMRSRMNFDVPTAITTLVLYDGEKGLSYSPSAPMATCTIAPALTDLGVPEPLPLQLALGPALSDKGILSLDGTDGLQGVTHYKAHWRPKPGALGGMWILWILPERGWCATRMESPGQQNQPTAEVEGFDWREIAPGFWFPMRVTSQQYVWRDGARHPALTDQVVIKDVKVNVPIAPDLFAWKPTRFTRMTDRRFSPPLQYDVTPERGYTEEELVRMHMERQEKAKKLKQERERKQQAPKQ